MKNYKEMAESVFERIEADNTEKQKKSKIRKRFLVPLVAVLMIASMGLGGWMINSRNNNVNINNDGGLTEPMSTEAMVDNDIYSGEPEIFPESGIETSNENYPETTAGKDGKTEMNNNANYGQQTIEAVTSETTATNNNADKSGGYEDGGVLDDHDSCIDGTIYVEGEEITDSEAQKYLADNYVSLASALSASGVPTDDLRFSEKGYCHVSYSATEEKHFKINQNFRDYLAYNDDRLVAIITLSKENGVIYNSPAFGAGWFDIFNANLQQHKGEKLIFAYIGDGFEIFITPDGRYCNTAGQEIGVEFDVNDIYHAFYHEKAVYIP